jgi:hypothetical protein
MSPGFLPRNSSATAMRGPGYIGVVQNPVERHVKVEQTLNMVPVEMSTLMTIRMGAGRTDWK